MNKPITLFTTGVLISILAIAGIVHYTTTASTLPDNKEALVATTTDTDAYNRGVEAGRTEFATEIRKEIITTGQLEVKIPLGNGTVKNMILIIKQ